MTAETELEAKVEDYQAVLAKLAERARNCRDDFEHRYMDGPAPGYEYEAGIVAGWENAAMMAQGLLLARAVSRKA